MVAQGFTMRQVALVHDELATARPNDCAPVGRRLRSRAQTRVGGLLRGAYSSNDLAPFRCISRMIDSTLAPCHRPEAVPRLFVRRVQLSRTSIGAEEMNWYQVSNTELYRFSAKLFPSRWKEVGWDDRTSRVQVHR